MQKSILTQKKIRKRGVKKKEDEAVQKSSVEPVLEEASTDEEDEEEVPSHAFTTANIRKIKKKGKISTINISDKNS